MALWEAPLGPRPASKDRWWRDSPHCGLRRSPGDRHPLLLFPRPTAVPSEGPAVDRISAFHPYHLSTRLNPFVFTEGKGSGPRRRTSPRRSLPQ